MDQLLNNENIKFIHTDVSLTTHSQIICDAHDLPFSDETFDGVIVQAVLEHVVDPYRCVEEIHRVLNEEGIVYAETPFMQQVHGGHTTSHDLPGWDIEDYFEDSKKYNPAAVVVPEWLLLIPGVIFFDLSHKIKQF